MTIAVLYVDPRGPYLASAALHDLSLWDEKRDARRYNGPHPIIAHPPCRHWGRLSHLAHVQCNDVRVTHDSQHPCGWSGRRSKLVHGTCPRCGSTAIMSDADCGPRAVEQVRRWGGVLEHPAGSRLWEHCALPLPGDDECGCYDRKAPGHVCSHSIGFSVEVNQVEWGHVARKRTWLYLVGVPRSALEAPPFPGREPTHWVSGGRGRAGKKAKTTPVPAGIKVASACQRRRTPPLFAEYLIRLARAAVRP